MFWKVYQPKRTPVRCCLIISCWIFADCLFRPIKNLQQPRIKIFEEFFLNYFSSYYSLVSKLILEYKRQWVIFKQRDGFGR